MIRVLVLINPEAGTKRRGRRREAALRALHTSFPHLETAVTQGPGDATRLARDAASVGVDLLIVAGGDGTASEALNGLVGSETALAPLPCGTGNALAREVGFPPDPLAAAIRLVGGRRRKIALGRVQGRYFALALGIGFDAHVISTTPPRLKRAWGPLAYALAAAPALLTYPYPTVRFRIGEEELEGTGGVIAKARVRIPWPIFPRASLEQPALTLLVYRGREPLAYLWKAPRILSGHAPTSCPVRTSTEITIEAVGTMQAHADGELLPSVPTRVEVVPEAVSLLYPIP